MNRLFFFRSSEGYDHDDRLDRLSIGDFRNTENDPVKNLIEEPTGVNAQDLTKSPVALQNTLRNKLGFTDYRRFVTDLFEYCGQKGDTFNLQLYFASDLDRSTLIENLDEHLRDEDPEDLLSDPVRSSLYDCEDRGGNIIDLRFAIAYDQYSDYSTVRDEELGEELVEDADEASVEVRVYINEGMIAISNSEMDKEEKLRIRQLIERWSGGTINSKVNLLENELLALQNALDGRNNGIDYGDFREDNIQRAKYRGQREFALSQSRVIEPARQDGRIVKLHFYHEYHNNGAKRDVLVRFHRDGHLTTANSKPTEPDFIDKIVEELVKIRKYEEYWGTLNDAIDDYIDDLMRERIHKGKNNYRTRKHKAMNSNIQEFISVEYQDVEEQVFVAVVFNIITDLIQAQVSGRLDSKTASESPEKQAEFKELLDSHAEYNLDQPNYEFDIVWGHLHDLLTSGDYNSPVSLIEAAKTQYEI